MQKISNSDASVITFIKKAASFFWLSGLVLGLLSIPARLLGHETMAGILLLLMWLPAIGFLVCIVLLLISTLLLFFSRSKGA